jgi:hypothetical protein
LIACRKFGLLPSVTATITTPKGYSCNPSIQPDKPIKVKARPIAERSDSIMLLYSAPYPYKACVTGFVVGAFNAATGTLATGSCCSWVHFCAACCVPVEYA